jgi:anti-anti-sigma factor
MSASRALFAVIRPVGELCEDTIGPLERALDEASGDVVVDASRVRIMSAAAMRVLVQARARLVAQDGSLVVEGASPFVAHSLEVVGLGDLLRR